MNELASLPPAVLAVGWLVLFGLAAAAARWSLRRFLSHEHQVAASSVAAPLMPALGAAFALLAALSLAGEASETRAADTNVSQEAAASSRLAWASTSPGLDGEAIQDALSTYLEATRTREWTTEDQHGNAVTLAALADLELVVRDAAATPGLGSAQAGELLNSLGSLTSLRRERLATAANTLPGSYVAVVVVSGLALVVNSAALGLATHPRVVVLTAGLIAVVGLSVALLFALSAPFSGGFETDDAPIADVASDLRDGLFR